MSSDAKDATKRALSDPAAVARRLGLDTRGADRREQRQGGGGVFVCCPWHAEKHPSCSLTRGGDGTLRAHCFTCGGGGDVFSLVAAVRSLDVARDFRAVLKEAAEIAGVDVQESERRQAPRREPPRPIFAPVAPPAVDVADRAFAALAAPLLHLGRLDGGPISRDVCAYLDGRGLLDVARGEGWAAFPPAGSEAARSWARMVRDVAPDVARALSVEVGAGKAARAVARALRALLARDRAFRGRRRPYTLRDPDFRLVLPYRAPDGTLYAWQRRSLDTRRDKYRAPPWALRWPYAAERLNGAPASASIVYCEGALDAAAVRFCEVAAGRAPIVLGVPGTTAWCDYFATFARGRVAFVASDNDAPNKQGKRPGEDAAQVWGASAYRGGAIEVRRVVPPDGAKDWSEALAALACGKAA